MIVCSRLERTLRAEYLTQESLEIKYILISVAIFCKDAVQQRVGVLIRGRSDNEPEYVWVILRYTNARVVELFVEIVVEYHELGGKVLRGLGLKMVELSVVVAVVAATDKHKTVVVVSK